MCVCCFSLVNSNHCNATQNNILAYVNTHIFSAQSSKTHSRTLSFYRNLASRVYHELNEPSKYHELHASSKCHELNASSKYHELHASSKYHELHASSEYHELHASSKCHQLNTSSKYHELNVSSKYHELTHMYLLTSSPASLHWNFDICIYLSIWIYYTDLYLYTDIRSILCVGLYYLYITQTYIYICI